MAGSCEQPPFRSRCLRAGSGFPRLLTVWFEWDLRDAGKVESFVASHLRPTDQVYSIYEAYYAAKSAAKGVVLPAYIGDVVTPDAPPGVISAAEREQIGVLILKPDCVDSSLAFFGGDWRQVARYTASSAGRVPLLKFLNVGSKPYDIIIYRRQSGLTSTAASDGKAGPAGKDQDG